MEYGGIFYDDENISLLQLLKQYAMNTYGGVKA
jgi:hypothetical protein